MTGLFSLFISPTTGFSYPASYWKLVDMKVPAWY